MQARLQELAENLKGAMTEGELGRVEALLEWLTTKL